VILPSGEIYQSIQDIQALVARLGTSIDLFEDRRSTRPTAFAKCFEKVKVAMRRMLVDDEHYCRREHSQNKD
jgi:hypothetical protein